LQQRIKEVEGIAWIEQDFAQETNSKLRPNLAFPAVLIDFPNADYSNIALGGITATITVSIRLFFAQFAQSYEADPEEVKEVALKYFELEQELINKLHGWQPDSDYAQPLMLTGITSNNRNNKGLRIREMRFTTAYEEYEKDNRHYKITERRQ
jgi:hypothetical protein